MQRATPVRIHTDPDQTFKSQKVKFFCMKNIIKVGSRSKTYLRRYKSLFERQETRFICKILSFSVLLDPDPHS